MLENRPIIARHNGICLLCKWLIFPVVVVLRCLPKDIEQVLNNPTSQEFNPQYIARLEDKFLSNVLTGGDNRSRCAFLCKFEVILSVHDFVVISFKFI